MAARFSPQLDLKRLAAVVWGQHDGIHEAAKDLGRFWTTLQILSRPWTSAARVSVPARCPVGPG
jgi:hypothetical protein